VIDDVHDLKEEVVITKHGKPMAKLIPIKKEPDDIFGAMRGQIEILGDLVEPITEPDEWDDEIFPPQNKAQSR
jgi:antitoxin (DNA-binding transcriptional repressor) of toxin-antitoxin stability system